MKYKIEEIDSYGTMLFTRVFKIKADTHYEEEYKEIAIWCCDYLQNPFVLLSYKTRLIAGGTTNNKNSYVQRQTEREKDDNGLISHYELRCDNKDAVLFKVRWI